MSCISSNFSSFFFNSLNDSSEFAKYLSNGELKLSPFEDLQVFGNGASVSQQQSQQSQYTTIQQQNQLSNNIINGSNQQQQAHQQQQQQQQQPLTNNGVDILAGVSGGAAVSGVSNGLVGNVTPMDTSPVPGIAQPQPQPQQQQQQQQQTQQHHTLSHPLHSQIHSNVALYAHAQQQQQQQIQNPGHVSNPTNNFLSNHHHGAAHNHTSAHHQLITGSLSSLPPHHQQQPGLSQQQQQQQPPSAAPPNVYPSPNTRWPIASGSSNSIQSTGALPTTTLHHTANNNHNAAAVAAAAAAAAAAASQSMGGSQHNPSGAQHFDGSFEFLKYLRHSSDFNNENISGNNSSSVGGSSVGSVGSIAQHPANAQQQQQQSASSLIDLDSTTTQKPRSASRKVAAMLSSVSRASNSLESTLDVFDHDSKHTLFDLQQMTNSSNSNESSMEMSNLAFPSSHLNASNSNTSSEGAAAGSSEFSLLNSSVSSAAAAAANANAATKPLTTFTIKENFEVHPSHKVEEGIFQHMNKLPPKKKENLKQLGVRFTGQMTLSDKSIVVENFIKFCQEYDIKDHRPFLSLNQSGLNKPEQIKFARYLGQGLPTFTLFCIYSNFKNLFCTKRTEMYTKDGYNLPYILEKTKRFLSNTTADLKNMLHQNSLDDYTAGVGVGIGIGGTNTNNNSSSTTNANMEFSRCVVPRALENLIIYDNFDIHESHRIEDGVCTHITRLPPKKQDLLKQFGIHSNQIVSYYEKYIIIENFIKFCNEYKITDHRPFLDFHESGLPKCEQLKFVRYLGQGLPNLTLNKIYVSFKDVLGLNRIEKITMDGYNLDTILKKKKKNLYNRMHAAGVL